MITKSNVRQLKQVLEQSLIVCNDMIRQRSFDSLFESEKDFRESEVARKLICDEYYKLIFFDTELSLRFHSSWKKYYIHIDSIDFKIFRSSEFKKTFSNYFADELFKPNDSGCNFTLNTDFNNSVIVFAKFCMFYLKHMIGTELFEIF